MDIGARVPVSLLVRARYLPTRSPVLSYWILVLTFRITCWYELPPYALPYLHTASRAVSAYARAARCPVLT
eukprot:2165273-Rhodomonas_salina.1